MGCMSACDDVYHRCSKIFDLAGINLLPNCNQTSPLTGLTLSSSNATCNSIPSKVTNPNAYYNLSAVPANFIAAKCPSPFIKDLDPFSSSSETLCLAGCCMPCPSQNFVSRRFPSLSFSNMTQFYPTGWTRRGFQATTILRAISSVLCLFMAISYLVLPDKRRHPSLLILNFSIALFVFSLVGFFSVGDPTRIQCANSTTPSTQDNNPLCAVQGALLIFGSLATCCWSAALILNLHLHTVWRSNFFSDRYDILNAFCWGYPAIIMAVILGLHKVKFEFADLCLVSMDAIFETFFYPMIAVICPAFLVHLATFVYIARMAFQESTLSETRHSTQSDPNPAGITTRTHKHVLVAVKIQWRALLLAVLAISAVVFYWIFYFTQINKMKTLVKDNSIKLNWIECMISPDGSQDNCTEDIRDYLPPFGVMIAAEAYVSSLGIWLAIVFGRMSLFRDWNDLLYDLRLFFTSRGSLKARNEQFFAL
ncbi:hypothetical protein G6F46_009161 [Rhizopus delemar]|nr:hypothetical protein G6F55_006801 [Rhizopus delemar]KAG1553693.1 hypothetical protein G6F51_000430 [Rhizopus arrhizus]KAG1498295.1 hypothetical protein G6F54_005182 [Rhizopus delemar]KAG1512757.1 hypothetical protein G6F53_004946 [Rhizopus delemar]KAG1516057.1 hypothetical protein G6F52_009535 [Rhizopus delemar]